MFELSVQCEFRAAHAIVMNGERETPHEHDWLVTLVVCGEALDADGLLCDFHEVERVLDEVIDPFKKVNLNETPPFDKVNPTAELVVKHIAETTQAKLGDTARVHRATITEAPGCMATYILPQ